jgi:hypothetical protein
MIGIVLFLGAGAAVFFALREKKLNGIVISNSTKISKLEEINESIGFNDIQSAFSVNKQYDNKSNYTKIEPAYLMAAELRKDIAFFSNYCSQLIDNRNKLLQYQAQLETILSGYYPLDYDAIKIKEPQFERRERRLFAKKELVPVADCSFVVTMSYTSPKGRVHLEKREVFNFDDLYSCLGSISRSHLDKETYRGLSNVERGEVSDSLRYDILRRDNFTCVICGASAREGARLHVDHIIPIAKGGKSVPENLRTLCERCNIGKSDKIEEAPSTSGDETCSLCGGKLVLRNGKYGQFYGCSNYPKCHFTKKL